MRWVLAGLGVAAIAVALTQPWFGAATVGGAATLTGWGHWSVQEAIEARLVPVPLGLTVAAPLVWVVVAAVRSRFGQAFIGSVAAVALTGLGIALHQRVAASVPGGDAVFVSLGSAPALVLGLTLVATVCAWYLFARTELRDPPTS
ncbi:hypothetical protein H7J07_16770 [Mycobacterium koreense]|uniref:hypothetical protein n=1 Tax=Mycolicibacillus koreensis TaxID=1069220 RepID=UPI000D6A75C2|nr:hypothetical protein [Mycolicibacillus koreensis]MCV7249854.1 hypothetical protein [Mycolicibacillus koreensis]